MFVNRRELVALAAGGVAAANANANAIAPAGQARAASGATIKAIAFDGFPIIDPRPVAARTEEIFRAEGWSWAMPGARGNSSTPGFGPSAATMPTSGRSRRNR